MVVLSVICPMICRLMALFRTIITLGAKRGFGKLLVTPYALKSGKPQGVMTNLYQIAI